MGVSAPSPILTEYGWPGKYAPFDHQRIMADVMTVHPRVFNLSEMGTGKTYAALWAADYLMRIGQVKRVAVITPLSTMHSVWEQDIFKILLHRQAVVVHGGRERRQKALSMDVDFYIINHHGVALDDVAQTLRKRKDIDLVILDEASAFRNHKTNTYKFLMWVLGKAAKRFWVMTGTPCPTEPADAWAPRSRCPPAGMKRSFTTRFSRRCGSSRVSA
jgi:SNF2 family DNA or RNA helicase